jgi:hypothetical protein
MTYLYLLNYQLANFDQVLRSLLIVLALLGIVWWSVQRWLNQPDKAALIVSVFFLLFFSYGHLLTSMTNYLQAWFGLGAEALVPLQSQTAMLVLLLVWVGVLGMVTMLTIQSKSDFRIVTQLMNVVSLTLLGLAIVKAGQLSLALRGNQGQVRDLLAAGQLTTPLTASCTETCPDIYYIILDGYARSDVMNQIFHYDNSEFIAHLRQRGFYVADQAHTNYNYTYVSLASSLNADYLSALNRQFAPTDNSVWAVFQLLTKNSVMKALRDTGYTLISLPAPLISNNLPADISLTPVSRISAFELQLIDTTPLRFLLHEQQHSAHRQWIHYQFATLPQTSVYPSPKFVFAHILVPHAPFVFKADGSAFNPPWEFTLLDSDNFTKRFGQDVFVESYRQQAIYTTAQATQLIDQLLTITPSPIIILQSDHGPGSQHHGTNVELIGNYDERFSILSAYYFPDQSYTALYPSITPVNSFRIILNQYFGGHYDLLEDRSYWINIEFPYAPVDVTEKLTSP